MLKIIGCKGLKGGVRVQGSKNSALPMMAAALLTKERVTLDNCPNITDAKDMAAILRSLGCSVKRSGGSVSITAGNSDGFAPTEDISKKIRSSFFIMGALTARRGRAKIYYPGGCDIGARPVDMHIAGLRRMGAEISCESDYVLCRGKLCGAEIALGFPSVGATENLIMAASLAKGRTVIHNAAKEPEICELAEIINAMGGKIYGAGSGTVYIDGVKALHGATARCKPDRIAAATYIAAAACAGGSIEIEEITKEHIAPFCGILGQMGAQIRFGENTAAVSVKKPLVCGNICVSTGPYPAFPTDMQPLLGAVMSCSEGKGIIFDRIFENRFGYAYELRKMGAETAVGDCCAEFRGKALAGAEVNARDLRGGAAIAAAALGAAGETIIRGSEKIYRGYEDFTGAFKGLGADIKEI